MVVIGDIYTEKGKAAQTRLKAEMKNLLSENLSIPVIETSELEEQIKFSFKNALKLIETLSISIIIFLGVFIYQQEILEFLAGESYHHLRVLAVVFVLLVTPIFAYSFGISMRQILRLLRLD